MGSATLRLRRVVSRLEPFTVSAPDPIPYGAPMRSPDRVRDAFRAMLADQSGEVFAVALLDGKHKLIALAEVSRGTLSSSLVHPREVFGPAVRLGAGAIIVAHNHPSGDPEPSLEDLAVTRRLIEAGRILGIPVLDHVVVGDGTFCSLRERMSEFGGGS